MAGLLDSMSPQQYGLLAAGLGMMGSRERTLGAAIGNGGIQGLNAMSQMQQQQFENQQAQQEYDLRQMKMQQMQDELQGQKAIRARMQGIDPTDTNALAKAFLDVGDYDSFLKLTQHKQGREGVPTGFVANQDGSIAPMPISGGGNYMDYQIQLANQKAQLPGYGEPERLALAQSAELRQQEEANRRLKEAGMRDLPQQQIDAQLGNMSSVGKIDNALSQVMAYPGAFGLKNMAGDAITSRVDPEGVAARAAVGELAGQKFHDISGAAISASEAPRLNIFIPKPTDDSETVVKKLKAMRKEYLSENKNRSGFFNQQGGYRKDLPQYQSPNTFDIQAPKPGQIMDGHLFKGGDPADQNSWEEL